MLLGTKESAWGDISASAEQDLDMQRGRNYRYGERQVLGVGEHGRCGICDVE